MYRTIAVDGDVAVAVGSTTYALEPGGPVDRVYDNCFVLQACAAITRGPAR
jgi:hypothetical protein